MSFTIAAYWYFVLATSLFGMGLWGILTQKSGIRILMSVEMMLNAANINFVAFASLNHATSGWVYALFVIAIAAAEAAVGLAIFVNVFRVRNTIDINKLDSMRW